MCSFIMCVEMSLTVLFIAPFKKKVIAVTAHALVASIESVVSSESGISKTFIGLILLPMIDKFHGQFPPYNFHVVNGIRGKTIKKNRISDHMTQATASMEASSTDSFVEAAESSIVSGVFFLGMFAKMHLTNSFAASEPLHYSVSRRRTTF